MRKRKVGLLQAYWANIKPAIQQILGVDPGVKQHFTDLQLPAPFVNETYGAQVAKIRGKNATAECSYGIAPQECVAQTP